MLTEGTPKLFTFKTPRLADEWPLVFEPLANRFLGFCNFAQTVMGKKAPLVITCIVRTPEENQIVGGVPRSMHMTSPTRAIDFRRTKSWTLQEIVEAKRWWEAAGPGWDFVPEGAPFNKKTPHFHVEADRRVRLG